MKNKIVLITGATGGIGKATALALHAKGAHLIIHGRDEKKTRLVAKEIESINGLGPVDVLIADMFLLSDVRRMAQEFNNRYTHLDVLVNNAGGIMSKDREVTAEGNEKTMAVNLFAPFLLTNLLMDKLLKSADGRIINVSSSSHRLNAKPDFGDMQLTTNYNPLTAYGNSKLFLILNTQYLSKYLTIRGATSPTVNSMHPGPVSTNFAMDSNLGTFLNTFTRIARLFFRSVEKGAETLVFLASEEKMRGLTGAYYIDKKPALVNRKYDTPENEKLVWEYCEKVTGSSLWS